MLNALDRLKPFYLVHTLGSVSGAAEALHVTQPAVSQAIKKLEEELKTQLFIRRNRHLFPTPTGDRLFTMVQPFFMELEKFRNELEHSRQHSFGELRIGAPTEFGKAYLPAIVAQFRGRYPEVTFHLEFALPETLVQLVEKGQLDFALVDLFLVHKQLKTNDSELRFEPALEERLILACSRQYYRNKIRGDITSELLAKQDFIEYTRTSHTILQWFTHHYNTSPATHRTVMTVDSHDAVISAIKHHTGLGIVATHLVANDLRSGDIVPIATPGSDILNQISFVHLQGKKPTLTEKVFKTHLKKAITQLGF